VIKPVHRHCPPLTEILQWSARPRFTPIYRMAVTLKRTCDICYPVLRITRSTASMNYCLGILRELSYSAFNPTLSIRDLNKATMWMTGLQRIVRLEYLPFVLACLFGVWGGITAVLILRRKGSLYRRLKPNSRPRRWVLFLLLYLVVFAAGWLGASVLWPESITARIGPAFFVIPLALFGVLTKWGLTPIVDKWIERRGWRLR
jgi:hypothetical protein